MPKPLSLCFPQLYVTFPFISGTVPKGPAVLELQQKSFPMSQPVGKSECKHWKGYGAQLQATHQRKDCMPL